ncbi:MAG: HD domain-containing protein [Elusimicrobiales bacterium]|jgi:tRNA nucleotidyltransferase/poly(A) polymerase
MTPAAAEILKLFEETYLVGGAVRDAALKRPVKDLDLAVKAGPDFDTRIRKLARGLKASVFPLDEDRRVYRLTQRATGLQLDISPFQGKDLTEDLLRRDFTVNALALPLTADYLPLPDGSTGLFRLPAVKIRKLIDPSGGLKDLKTGTIRLVSREALAEDPLRLLRAFRFSAALGFRIAPNTLKLVKLNSALITKAAPERIHDELLMILASPAAAARTKELYAAGLLTAILPELEAQRTCAEVYYGKGGVLKHTFAVMERLDHLFENIGAYIPNWGKISESFAEKNILKLAALLHDVAKPPCARLINGRLRFFGHEEHGAALSWRIMERLRFSKDHRKLLSRTIGNHLRPGNLASNDAVSDRAVFRFFRTMGEYTIPLLILSWADHSSYITLSQLRSIRDRIKEPPFEIPKGGLPQNGIKKTLRFLQVLNLLFKTYISKNIKLKTLRLIDGHDVIRILRMKPGPEVGEILEKVSLRQFEGRIKTRRQALHFLKNLYKQAERKAIP